MYRTHHMIAIMPLDEVNQKDFQLLEATNHYNHYDNWIDKFITVTEI